MRSSRDLLDIDSPRPRPLFLHQRQPGQTAGFHDISQYPVRLESSVQTKRGIGSEQPANDRASKFAIHPTRHSKEEYAVLRHARRPGQRPAIVVVPGAEISLGRPLGVDRVRNNRRRAVNNFFSRAYQPFAKFGVITRNGVLMAADAEIEPKESVTLKKLPPKGRICAQGGDTDLLQLVSKIEAHNRKLVFHGQPRRLRMIPSRHNPSRNGSAFVLLESFLETGKPEFIQNDVVISEGDNIPCRRRDTGIQRSGSSLLTLKDVAQRKLAHEFFDHQPCP